MEHMKNAIIEVFMLYNHLSLYFLSAIISDEMISLNEIWKSTIILCWFPKDQVIDKTFYSLVHSKLEMTFWNTKHGWLDSFEILPQLVRMRTIKLMSFSGFVLIEMAHSPRGRTIQLFTFWPISQMNFSKIFDKKPLFLTNFLRFLAFLSEEALK